MSLSEAVVDSIVVIDDWKNCWVPSMTKLMPMDVNDNETSAQKTLIIHGPSSA